MRRSENRPDRAVHVAAVAIVFFITIEQRRHDLRWQGRGRELLIAVENPDDLLPELPRRRMIVRKLAISLYRPGQIAGAAAAVGPVGLLKSCAALFQAFRIENLFQMYQHRGFRPPVFINNRD